MSDNNKRPTNQFNKAAKGAAIGAGAAVVIGAVTILPVSLPIIAVGAAIGGFLGYKRGK
jgi:hypothetical protein